MSQPIKFVAGKIKFNTKGAVLTLPKSLAKLLYPKDADDSARDLYMTVVNGVLQASVDKPDCVIPMLNLKPENFVPLKVDEQH